MMQPTSTRTRSRPTLTSAVWAAFALESLLSSLVLARTKGSLSGYMKPAFIAMLMVVSIAVIHKRRFTINWNGYLSTIWVLWLILLAGLMFSADTAYGVMKTTRLAVLGVIPATLALTVFLRKPYVDAYHRWLYRLSLVGTATVLLIWLSGGGKYMDNRFYVFSEGPIVFGRMIGLCILVFRYNCLLQKGSLLSWISYLVGWFLMFQSASRGPALACLLADLLLLAFAIRAGNSRKVFWQGMILLVILAVGAAAYAPRLVQMASSLGSNFLRPKETPRLVLMKEQTKYLVLNPVFGIGTGSLAALDRYQYPHNIVLELLIENGIPGIALCLMALYWLVKAAVRSYRLGHFSGNVLDTAIAIFAVMNSLMSGNVADNAFVWAAGAIQLSSLRLDLSHKESDL